MFFYSALLQKVALCDILNSERPERGKAMPHSEYKRILQDAKKAYLFVHGIIGTPDHFDDLMPLVPDDVTAWKLVLDGHGKGPSDFARASMKKWKRTVKAAVDELAESHDEIYIVAHSMGTLLSMEQAIANDKIKGLFWLQSPLRLWIRPKMVPMVMKVYLNLIKEDDLPAISARHCCGIIHSKNILRYVGWIPRFWELFEKMRVTRWNLKHLKTPCVVCQSRIDEMVSNRSAKLLRKNPCVTVYELEGSGHFYYTEDDLAVILREFKKFIG